MAAADMYAVPGPASACAFAEEHHAHRLDEYDQVEQQRVVLHVVQVVLQLAHRVLDGGAVDVAHLRPAGETGLDGMAHAVESHPLRELGHEVRPLRTRPHETHL